MFKVFVVMAIHYQKDFGPGNIVGNSSKMCDVYSLVNMVAGKYSRVGELHRMGLYIVQR